MVKKQDVKNDEFEQSWLKKSSWLSLTIFFFTYGVFGWSFADLSRSWLVYLREIGESFNIFLEDELLLLLIRLIALIVIIAISLSLTTPIALLTFVFEETISSEVKAFLYILLWSIIAVFILSSFDVFADLLVVISANILLRIDLQKERFSTWKVFLLMIFFATLAFTGGVIAFDSTTQTNNI